MIDRSFLLQTLGGLAPATTENQNKIQLSTELYGKDTLTKSFYVTSRHHKMLIQHLDLLNLKTLVNLLST